MSELSVLTLADPKYLAGIHHGWHDPESSSGAGSRQRTEGTREPDHPAVS